MALVQLTTSPAVSLDEAKAHLRIVGTGDDATLTGFILAATQYVEAETRVAIASGDYVLTLAGFPAGQIAIPRPPLVAVAAIRYVDADGTPRTLAPSAYYVDTDARPGRIAPAVGAAWPATSPRSNAVRVEFVAGYDPADVPQLLKQAVLLM